MATELVSMEKDDDDVLDHIAVNPVLDSRFPYNLRIALTEKEFEKLGCDPMVAVKDAIVEGRFKGKIKDVHHDNPGTDKHCCRVEIQITDLGLECESEDEENEEEEE